MIKSSLLKYRHSPLVSNQFRRSYHERVIDHYENPRNVGNLDKNNVNVGTGLVGAPACGMAYPFLYLNNFEIYTFVLYSNFPIQYRRCNETANPS